MISSHKSFSQNPIDFDDYIDNIDIQEENSKIKQRSINNNEENIDNTLSSFLFHFTNNNINLIPVDERLFFIKKKEIYT